MSNAYIHYSRLTCEALLSLVKVPTLRLTVSLIILKTIFSNSLVFTTNLGIKLPNYSTTLRTVVNFIRSETNKERRLELYSAYLQFTL